MSETHDPHPGAAARPDGLETWKTGELDFTAFSLPHDFNEAKGVETTLRRTMPLIAPLWDAQVWVDWILTIGGYLAGIIIFPLWLSSVIGYLTWDHPYPPADTTSGPRPFVGIAGLLWVFAAAAIWGTFRLRRARNRGYLWWRLLRFADDNGLIYRPWSKVTGSTTSLVRGHKRFWFEDRFQPTTAPHDLTVATLVIGGASANFNAGERKWGFIQMRLGRSLPHIVVETTDRGRAISDYGMLESDGFELEGDFPRHNRVYVADADRATALELLTPDVMAAIVDETAGFDLEVRGDQLSLSSPQLADLAYPATLARLFRIATVVGTEARTLSMRRGDARFDVEVAEALPARMRQRRIPRGALRGLLIAAVAVGVPTIITLVTLNIRFG